MVRINLMVTPVYHMPSTIAGMMNMPRLASASSPKDTQAVRGDQFHQIEG